MSASIETKTAGSDFELHAEDWLLWAKSHHPLSVVEAAAQQAQLTLGVVAQLVPDMTLAEAARQRVLVRSNSALGRIEDAVAAFEYEHEGQLHRTFSSPREACGPELRQRLFAKGRSFTGLQIRLQRNDPIRWMRFLAPSAGVAQSFTRACFVAGSFARIAWGEGANGWLGFAGAMAEVHQKIAQQVALPFSIETKDGEGPSIRPLTSGSSLLVTGWAHLPSPQFYLADPWAALVKREQS